MRTFRVVKSRRASSFLRARRGGRGRGGAGECRASRRGGAHGVGRRGLSGQRGAHLLELPVREVEPIGPAEPRDELPRGHRVALRASARLRSPGPCPWRSRSCPSTRSPTRRRQQHRGLRRERPVVRRDQHHLGHAAQHRERLGVASMSVPRPTTACTWPALTACSRSFSEPTLALLATATAPARLGFWSTLRRISSPRHGPFADR
jgi:hypothetical protein